MDFRNQFICRPVKVAFPIRTGEVKADAHLKRQITGREVVVAVNRRKRVLVKIIGE